MLTKETIKKIKAMSDQTTRNWSLRVRRVAGELYQTGNAQTECSEIELTEARALCSLMKARD